MYFNLISIFELKIARPSLVCSFMINEWSLEDRDLNTQLFTEVELFMKSCIVTVGHLIIIIIITVLIRVVDKRITTIILSLDLY